MTSDRSGVDDARGSDPSTTDRSPLDAAIDDASVAGFVAVGGRFDPDLRYLTRIEGPEDGVAFVRVPGTSVLCVPSGHAARAERAFDGRVATARAGDPAGERAVAVLDGLVGSDGVSTVLVPPAIPHDAAVYLERGGYTLRSTTAVTDARTTKAGGEIDAIRAVQTAATGAVRRVERVVATADVDGGELRRDGRRLTVERLRRAANAELAARGVTDAGNTVVAAGGAARRGGGSGQPGAGHTESPIRADDPVAVGVAPRGPHGYHGSLARTFVVDSDGGWERRAYVAVESALDAALGAIEAGAVAADVGREVDAELAAFGFEPAGGGDVGGSPTPGHGVGLSRRERPSLRAEAELAVGTVVAVTPAVTDPDAGVVRLRDPVVVRPDGHELLGGGDRAFTPRS